MSKLSNLAPGNVYAMSAPEYNNTFRCGRTGDLKNRMGVAKTHSPTGQCQYVHTLKTEDMYIHENLMFRLLKPFRLINANTNRLNSYVNCTIDTLKSCMNIVHKYMTDKSKRQLNTINSEMRRSPKAKDQQLTEMVRTINKTAVVRNRQRQARHQTVTKRRYSRKR